MKRPKQIGGKPLRLRSWRVVLNRRDFLGYVEAPSAEIAETLAAERFGLTEFYRKRLLLQERL